MSEHVYHTRKGLVGTFKIAVHQISNGHEIKEGGPSRQKRQIKESAVVAYGNNCSREIKPVWAELIREEVITLTKHGTAGNS
jgi:hypothetical protein